MTKQLHIVPGASAAGSLKQALRLKKEDVLLFEDSLDGGPILDFQSLEEWSARRNTYWNEFIIIDDELLKPLSHVFNEAVDCVQCLSGADEIILWVGGDVREQLYLLWVIRLFECYQLDFTKIRLIETYRTDRYAVTGVGIYNPEQLEKFFNGKHRSLEEQDITELKKAWNAVTASTPNALMQRYASGSARFPSLAESLKHFIKRYPNHKTGFNFHQSFLLQQLHNGPSATRIIGFTMGKMDEQSLDFVGDIYLFDALKKLGDEKLPHPALMLTGDLSNLRETEVRLTDMGKQFMAGTANFVQLNGLDYWVGGVHLTPENLWYYDNGKLIQA